MKGRGGEIPARTSWNTDPKVSAPQSGNPEAESRRVEESPSYLRPTYYILAKDIPGPPPESYVCVCMLSLSRVQLFATPWTIAHQAPLSMGFPRQEY